MKVFETIEKLLPGRNGVRIARDAVLQSNLGCGVLPEERAFADVSAQRGERAMPGLAHDQPLGNSIGRHLGGQTRAKTVPGKLMRVIACIQAGPLHNPADRIWVQSAGRYLPMPVDSPEQWTRGDSRYLQP